MILYILFTIAILIVETYFFYIPLKEIKEIKNKKDKIILFIGIFLSNIISTIIFNTSIFRYILCFIIIYIFIKMFKLDYIKNNTFYDFFVIPTLFLLKMILEFIIYLIFFKFVNYIFFVIILETTCICFINLFKKYYKKIYKLIQENWNNEKSFYCRYTILVTFNTIIMFLIYNLIKIKEVF